MKQLNLFKTFLFVALLGTISIGVQAQNYHPLAFGTGGVYSAPNWYESYVGLNMTVSAPASVAGSYIYTYAYGTGGTGTWGGAVTAPLVNDTLKVGPPTDIAGCSGFTPGYFTDRIALLWRGPISGACDFSVKAYNAQVAGAIAVVLMNEYPGEGPVAMGSGTDGSSVTIPVFQIGNVQGTLLDSACNDGIVTMTISPWGVNLPNNLGFVPGGTAFAHDFAVPYDQLTGGTSPSAYLGLDGAYIANYGTKTEHGVRVAATLTQGSTVINSDTTEVLDSFPVRDSIWAMYVPTTYNLPAASGATQYTLTYNILSDSTNDVPGNATVSMNFWASDSVYSKGSYDFTRNVPLYTDATAAVAAGSTAAEDFIWGNMYHVNTGGDYISAAQFSLSNSFGGYFTSGELANVMVFQWTDANSDGAVEPNELNIVALAAYNFNPGADSSGTVIKTSPLGTVVDASNPYGGGFGDTTGGYYGGIPLQANTSYYVAVNVTNGMLMYYDGQLDAYPRVYGRFMHDSTLDYSNFDIGGDYSVPSIGNPGSFTETDPWFPPVSFPGVSYLYSIDSVNYNEQKGLIPALALITTKTPPAFTGVKNVANAAKELSVFPIPTSDNLTVSVNLTQTSPTVTYTIIDGLARFVSKQTHNNVLSEQFDISTANLPAGPYFLIVNANGKAMSRKFIVVR